MESGAAARRRGARWVRRLRGTRGTRAPRPAIGAFLTCAAALVACFLALPGRRPLWWALLGLAAVAAVGVGVRRYRPRPTAPWLLLAAALLAQAAGELAYHAAGGTVGGRSPFPTAADGFLLAVYPLAIAALAAFVRRDPREYRRDRLLDVLIVVSGLSAVTWSVFIVPYMRLADESVFDKTILIAYLVGDAVLLAMTLRLPLAGRLRSAPVGLLVLGTLGVVFSDAYYGLAQLHPAWSPGRVADLGWAVLFVCWGLAALLPSMARVAEPPPDRPWALVAPRTWVVLLWCVALLSPVLLLFDTPRASRRNDIVLAACCVALFALVFARLLQTMRAWRESMLRRETEEYLRTLVSDASDAIIIASPEGAVGFASRSAGLLFGEKLAHGHGSVPELFGGRDRELIAGCFDALAGAPAADRLPWPTAVHFTAQGGRAVQAEARWSDLRRDPTVRGISLTLRDVTDERRLEDRLRRQALTDPLTGLVNRQGLVERLHAADPTEIPAGDVGRDGRGGTTVTAGMRVTAGCS